MPSRRQSPRPAKSRHFQRPPGAQGTQGVQDAQGVQGIPEAQWPSEAQGAPAAHGTSEVQWPPGTQSALAAGWPTEAQWPAEAQWPPDVQGDLEAEGTLEAQGAPDTSPRGALGPEDPDAPPWRPGDPDASPRGPEGPEDPEAAARQICLRLLTIEPRSRSQLAEALRRQHIPGPGRRSGPRPVYRGGPDRRSGLRPGLGGVEAPQSRPFPPRAAAELHRRGLADEDVHNAIELVDDDQEAATARRLIAGKVRTTRGQPRGTGPQAMGVLRAEGIRTSLGLPRRPRGSRGWGGGDRPGHRGARS